MRELKYISFLLFVAVCMIGSAQPPTNSQSTLYLFADRDYCISGDTVWFKAEIRNGRTGKSNVVHVQLDNGGKQLISSVKMKSKDNWAEGFIYIPDSLSSGVYFLTAFLNSQRNASAWEPVKKTLFVYNRFDQEITKLQVPRPDKKIEVTDFSDQIGLTTAKQVYSPREKVSVDINMKNIDTTKIRRVVVRATFLDELSTIYGGRFQTNATPSKSSIPAIDEMDGFLASGLVTDAATGEPAEKVVVLLSLYSEMPYLDYYLTGEDGNFRFFLKDATGTANVVFQAVSEGDREFNIRVDENYVVGDGINFQQKILTPAQSEFISAVIDGAFFERLFGGFYQVGNDTFFMPARFEYPFYGEPYNRIVPAEFFDLPDFQQISRELLHGVQYRVRDEVVTLRLLNEPENIYFRADPLRLINGIPVFKNRLFASLNSNDIEYIDYVLEERIYGDLNFKGVLSVSLKDKSNNWMTQQPNFFRISLAGLQPEKNPNYSPVPAQKENLPDIRSVNFFRRIKAGGDYTVEFFLSDLKGKVEISVEGVTDDNSIFKTSKIIEIK